MTAAVPVPTVEPSTVVRTATRGVVAAMAMSGLRQVTRALGLVAQTPPESVLQRTAPRLLRRVPPPRRPALVELAHWAYGVVGGAAFGALPAGWRQRRWAGPGYGLVVWAAFEGGIAPLLGITRRPTHGPVEAAMLLADHLLYGIVVAGPPGPPAARAEPRPPATGGGREAPQRAVTGVESGGPR